MQIASLGTKSPYMNTKTKELVWIHDFIADTKEAFKLSVFNSDGESFVPTKKPVDVNAKVFALTLSEKFGSQFLLTQQVCFGLPQ